MKLENSNLENPQYLEISAELIRIGELDQAYREKLARGEAEWSTTLDDENNRILKQFVDQIGWPTISKVGQSANEYAWLIVQHSNDREFQKQSLQQMKLAAEQNDTPFSHVAYLEDRLMCITSNQQLYGTQYQFTPDGRRLPFQIQDKENVNQRRAKAGLPPLGPEVLNVDYQGYEVKWGN